VAPPGRVGGEINAGAAVGELAVFSGHQNLGVSGYMQYNSYKLAFQGPFGPNLHFSA
jgi:hypothetical protein